MINWATLAAKPAFGLRNSRPPTLSSEPHQSKPNAQLGRRHDAKQIPTFRWTPSVGGFFPKPLLEGFRGVGTVGSETGGAVFPQLLVGVPAIGTQGVPRFGCF